MRVFLCSCLLFMVAVAPCHAQWDKAGQTATTATALAANGANCSAGNAPLGVDASGASEGCYDVSTQPELDTHAADIAPHSATSSNTANRLMLRDTNGDAAARDMLLRTAQETRASTQTLTATNQIDCALGGVIPIAGSGGAVDLTSNPQVLAGTRAGQRCVIEGTNSTNTVKLDNGTGLTLQASATLGNDQFLTLRWDGTIWIEEQPIHLKNNLGATVDPTGIDDAAAGYSVGSVWINLTDDTTWSCVDATAAAAVWKQTNNVATTLQTAHDASGASPKIDVGANGLVILDLTSATKRFDLCDATETQCWRFYIDATDGPVMTTKVAVDPITKIPATKDYRIKNSAGTDLVAIDEATGDISLFDQLFTDNLGIEAEESDVNPTCAAGNYNIYADLSETKWKKCQNGVVSDLAAAATTTTTTSAPMKLSTVSVSNANAFVDTIDGTNFDYSATRFVDLQTGDSFYTFRIPNDLAATPAWNLILTHKAVSGVGGNVSLFIECLDFATNVAFDAALTDLFGASANPDEKAVSTSANTTITTISGTNFDATEAIAAGNFLVCRVQRAGADALDTLGVDWLLLDVSVRYDVTIG